MARITVEEQPEFLVFPDDSILDLMIQECTVREIQGQRGSFEKLEFKFKILGIQALGDGSPVSTFDEMVGKEIWGSVPFKLTTSPDNRLRQWAEAIFNMQLGVGFDLDTDNFVRRQVRGLTSTYEKKGTRGADGQAYKRHQVESLLPTGGTAPAAAPAAPTTAAPTSDAWAPAPATAGAPAGASAAWSEDPPF